jgi:hypothetical protein
VLAFTLFAFFGLLTLSRSWAPFFLAFIPLVPAVAAVVYASKAMREPVEAALARRGFEVSVQAEQTLR